MITVIVNIRKVINYLCSMKSYILALVMLVVILTACSAPHRGFNYKKHDNYQKKMVKKMERVNKRPGKTYIMIQNLDKK